MLDPSSSLAATSAATPPTPAAAARLTIDLAALVANWRALGALALTTTVGAVVKGDAYGIGIAYAVPPLAAAGCRLFFVAVLQEGVQLRALAPDATIVVLGGFVAGTGSVYSAARLIPTLGSLAEVDDWLAETAHSAVDLPTALHVDTGMNRLGMTQHEVERLAADHGCLGKLRPSLLMSHLATADTPDHPLNAAQRDRFAAARACFPSLPASLANSAALLSMPAAHLDVARPGIALYGGACLAHAPNPMRPVVTMEAQILQIRKVGRGESIGYGAAYEAQHPMRIAVLSAGYADGYPRAAGTGGAMAALRGHPIPLVGRVSMDLIAVDVTDLRETLAVRGAWVELIGPNAALDDVAAAAGTIGYEILTGLGRRFDRQYLPA